MIAVEPLKTWRDFKHRVAVRYLQIGVEQRRRVWFRGQASNAWSLEPSIDRLERRFTDDEDRSRYASWLVRDFRQNAYGLQLSGERPEQAQDWEFLGRHHGLPTMILDWTLSPYVAAYFAFQETPIADHVSVWVLLTNKIDLDRLDGIEIYPFEELLRFNLRAAEQLGLSMRISSMAKPVEERLAKALLRIDIPSTEREQALNDLDEMTINHRTLFRDLDSAARVAMIRQGAM